MTVDARPVTLCLRTVKHQKLPAASTVIPLICRLPWFSATYHICQSLSSPWYHFPVIFLHHLSNQPLENWMQLPPYHSEPFVTAVVTVTCCSFASLAAGYCSPASLQPAPLIWACCLPAPRSTTCSLCRQDKCLWQGQKEIERQTLLSPYLWTLPIVWV